ncbi:MAG: hypothetical protein JRH20_30895 [Deltaproteobacteria bacterium]|nr:hypothetical protein [Deltaproteobacteria bacterium]
MTTAYRKNAFVASCHCTADAHLLCAECSSPLCTSHISVAGLCADCEISRAISRRTRRETRHVLALLTALLTGAAALLTAGVVPAVLVAPSGYAMARVLGSLFIRQRRAKKLIDGPVLHLEIAASGNRKSGVRSYSRGRAPNRMLNEVAVISMRTWGS